MVEPTISANDPLLLNRSSTSRPLVIYNIIVIFNGIDRNQMNPGSLEEQRVLLIIEQSF